jgi:hypothetical protein
MIITSLILLLLSNAITLRHDKSILYARATIIILLTSVLITYDNLYFLFLNNGIGIFGGLFHTTCITNVFNIFILTISSVILLLTSFYPRKVWLKEYSSLNKFLFSNLIYYETVILNKMGEQFKIIEYSLIILFIVTGAIFLISTSDLVSIFLSIELQSYGLYLLSTIYRDSEPATSGGLMYFLLGGLSSCFILLSTSLLYANSGTTNLDSLYIITSISNASIDTPYISSLLYWYKSYYIHISLLIMSVGFLFKVSAAPFHFWSPEQWSGKSLALALCTRDKLPNSGDALELKLPIHSRKPVGGWMNHSCMVTTLKTSEKKGGNRGSKSVTSLYLNKTVKEQRVYGSWHGFSCLRCTLLGFERNRSVKIPSNQITQTRLYTNIISIPILPWFITGFVDAEGCFTLIARKSPRSSQGWKIEANFIINLHKKDRKLLNVIQKYFGDIGRLSKERNGCCDFTVSYIKQIITVIIPHFDKYLLITQKQADYILFRKAVLMMNNGKHLTSEGLNRIINIRASINRGLTPALKEAFPKYIPKPRPLIDVRNSLTIQPQWVAGFASGDGSFIARLRVNDYNAGKSVELVFVLTQHIRDISLIKCLKDFFGCGQVYSYKQYAEFKCQNFKEIYEIILPFFLKHSILGCKSKDFQDWTKIAEIINSSAHLTKEGFEQIRVIRVGMNRSRESH